MSCIMMEISSTKRDLKGVDIRNEMAFRGDNVDVSENGYVTTGMIRFRKRASFESRVERKISRNIWLHVILACVFYHLFIHYK